MGKRVLLTGIGGFLGCHAFAHICDNTDWHVVGIDSFRHRGLTDRVTHMTAAHPEWKSRLTLHTHDLAAPFSDQMVKGFGNIDYIISMASESHVDRSIADPVTFFQNNVNLTLTLLELARKVEPYAFVNIGTDEVYGPAEPGHRHVEWEAILPSNPYAASKAAQEALAISYFRTYDVPVVLTNSMNLVGELQHPEKFIPSVIRNVLAGQEQIIHGSENNIGSRFYLHARDHSDAILFLLDKSPARYSNGDTRPDRYNIVGEKEFNNLDMAYMVAEIIGKPLKYRLVDFHLSRPGHDRRYALSSSKMEELGWTPALGIESTIRSTVEWYMRPMNRKWLDI